MRVAVAFIATPFIPNSWNIMEIMESGLREELERRGVKVIDATRDAMSVSYDVEGFERVIVVGAKSRGREEGAYVRRAEPPKRLDHEMARASLLGSLDLDDFINAFMVFKPKEVKEVYIIECEGSCKGLREKIMELIE